MRGWCGCRGSLVEINEAWLYTLGSWAQSEPVLAKIKYLFQENHCIVYKECLGQIGEGIAWSWGFHKTQSH